MRTKEKRAFGIGGCILLLSLLSACGGGTVSVTILDGQTETRLSLRQGQTVADALKEAEIPVTERDVVTPGKETALTGAASQISIERYAKVVVADGGDVTELDLTGKTVQDAFHEAGISLGEHDYVNHSPGAYLSDGMRIDVIRRLEVSIDVDGEEVRCLTKAADVEGLLAEQNISLDKKDRISPALSSKLKEGSRVTVERVSVKEVVEREPIDFETAVEYSGQMYEDESTEKTPGKKGEKEVTYQVTYVDGREESRKAVKETVITEPVSQVIVKGTKQRRRIVSKHAVPDCDGSGHGYYIITWSDGTVEYQDY